MIVVPLLHSNSCMMQLASKYKVSSNILESTTFYKIWLKRMGYGVKLSAGRGTILSNIYLCKFENFETMNHPTHFFM